MFLKSIKTITNNLKKGTTWLKLSFGLGILLMMVIIVNAHAPIKEGFSFEKKFIEKTGDGIYDNFYASIYDDLVYSDIKNEYEIGETVSWSELFHDGRSYTDYEYIGEIVKINRSTVDVKIKCGDIYRVHSTELK